MSEVCDFVGVGLNESARELLPDNLSELVEITTKHYKELLIKIMFEEGEEKNGKRTENTRYTETK